MSSPSSGRVSKLTGAYRGLAILTLNTLLLVLVLNLVAAWWLAASPDPERQGAMTYGLETLQRVYPGRPPDEIERLLAETWSRRYVYEPFTQFKEGTFSGEFVNVSAAGFRDTGFGLPWPPAVGRTAVFTFGGSTTFGYGVADDETIPARLQSALSRSCGEDIAVYNLARSNYYSSQERVLFQRLLVQGIRPTLALFIDGLNEFGHPDDEPKFTARLAYMMEETPAQLGRRWLVNTPLALLVKRLLRHDEARQSESASKEHARRIVDRWLANRRQIRSVAEAAGVETLFVWQPIPSYGYDQSYHLFADTARGDPASALGFEVLAQERGAPEIAEDLVWLADMQTDRKEPLYVDQVHYTATFSSEIARAIAERAAPLVCPESDLLSRAGL